MKKINPLIFDLALLIIAEIFFVVAAWGVWSSWSSIIREHTGMEPPFSIFLAFALIVGNILMYDAILKKWIRAYREAKKLGKAIDALKPYEGKELTPKEIAEILKKNEKLDPHYLLLALPAVNIKIKEESEYLDKQDYENLKKIYGWKTNSTSYLVIPNRNPRNNIKKTRYP